MIKFDLRALASRFETAGAHEPALELHKLHLANGVPRASVRQLAEGTSNYAVILVGLEHTVGDYDALFKRYAMWCLTDSGLFSPENIAFIEHGAAEITNGEKIEGSPDINNVDSMEVMFFPQVFSGAKAAALCSTWVYDVSGNSHEIAVKMRDKLFSICDAGEWVE